MSQNPYGATSRGRVLLLTPGAARSKQQWVAGSVAALLLMLLLLSFVSVVQAQVARGEQLRQKRSSATAASVASTPREAGAMQPGVAVAVPRAEGFRF